MKNSNITDNDCHLVVETLIPELELESCILISMDPLHANVRKYFYVRIISYCLGR